MLRIIAGEFRSRRLISPDESEDSRPYLNRVKESVFSLLRGWFEGTSVLDLFAGVGTVGLEAVSRGAKRVVMIERSRAMFEILQRNIAALGCSDRAQAIAADALSASTLMHIAGPFDLVFIDPPFSMMEDIEQRQRVLEQAARCRGLMGEKGFLILRSPIGPEEAPLKIEGFAGPEQHEYGTRMHVLLYSPASAGS